MIENEEGVRQAEQIMRTEGLGAIYVGASDLSIAMGMDCVPTTATRACSIASRG